MAAVPQHDQWKRPAGEVGRVMHGGEEFDRAVTDSHRPRIIDIYKRVPEPTKDVPKP